MVTTNDILNLGFKHVATAMNGGSKLFVINDIYGLESNYDNFLIDPDKKFEITLKRINKETLNWTILYFGKPTLKELEIIVEENCK